MSQTLSCDSHYDPRFSSGKQNNGRQLLVVICLYGLKKLRAVGRGADQHRWGARSWLWPLLWLFSEAPALLLGQSPLGLEFPAATSHPDHVLFLSAPSKFVLIFPLFISIVIITAWTGDQTHAFPERDARVLPLFYLLFKLGSSVAWLDSIQRYYQIVNLTWPFSQE